MTIRPRHDGGTQVSSGSRWRRFESTILATAALLGATPLVYAGPLERVPQDGTLEEAFEQVSDGGVIEIAGGVYPAPEQGWRPVSGRRFTVRATGPGVVLDGQGSRRIMLLRGQAGGPQRTVTFEGITFRGGFSTTSNRAGGVTIIEGGEAVFTDCAFELNHHDNNGGGAVRIGAQSNVRFTRCRFVDNESQRWGAAIFVQDSSVDVTGSELIGNRTNIAGHSPTSAGGAIYVLDSQLSVSRSLFTLNEAGWVGGAIYSIGNWREAAEGPASQVTITDSVFVHNAATPDPFSFVPGPPGGGAIHAEDHTDLLIRGSRFDENVATWGGAVQSYRALIEIEGSVFRGNRGEPTGTHVAAGGTINLTSSDFADESTAYGAINRRPAELRLRDSLLLGRFGSTTHAALQGGCLFVGGDGTRLAGIGVPQHGTAADNRARVKLDHVIFADCDIGARPGVQALGGAILALLADLEMTSSQVIDSDSPESGGALLSLNDSRLIFRDSAFAGNTAGDSGAGLQVDTGHVEIRDCLFVDNDVSPGVDEFEHASQGSALVLARKDERGITGIVERSVFSGNSGISIEDRDSRFGNSNQVTYVDNRFHSPGLGPKVYKNTPYSFGALTAAELNSFLMPHSDGPFAKGTGNSYHDSPPAAASLVAAPGAIGTPTSAGDPALASAFLGYVWSGTSAVLAGDSLGLRAGLLEVTEPGQYELHVAGDGAASAAVTLGHSGPPPPNTMPCVRDAQTACLLDERFEVKVSMKNFANPPVTFAGVIQLYQGASSESEQSVSFYSFTDGSVETFVKLVDACDSPSFNSFWLFAAGATNAQTTIAVRDTDTGLVRTVSNPGGQLFQSVADTQAFKTCASGRYRPPRTASGPFRVGASAVTAASATAPAPRGTAPCVRNATTACLLGDRFEVKVRMWDFASPPKEFPGRVQTYQGVSSETEQSVSFYSFENGNVEIFVKMVDACASPSFHAFWLFAAGATNAETEVLVRDSVTGLEQRLFNPRNRLFRTVANTGAFSTCSSGG